MACAVTQIPCHAHGATSPGRTLPVTPECDMLNPSITPTKGLSLTVDLTKWPRLLVTGQPVTEDQANDILIRTDDWYIVGNAPLRERIKPQAALLHRRLTRPKARR